MKGDHESITSHGSSGIAFTDEESIIAHLDNFCNHIRSMIDVIHTLSQFSKLANEVQNLPRVTGDVITNSHDVEDDQVASEMYFKTDAGGLRPAGAAASIGSGSDHSYPGIMSMKNKIDTIIVHLHFPWAKTGLKRVHSRSKGDWIQVMATLGDKMNLFPPLIKLVWSKWINFNCVLYFYIYLNCDSY